MDKDKQGQHGGQGHPDRPHPDRDKDKEQPGHQAPQQDPTRKPRPGGGQGEQGDRR
jgi:hypothetical protein